MRLPNLNVVILVKCAIQVVVCVMEMPIIALELVLDLPI